MNRGKCKKMFVVAVRYLCLNKLTYKLIKEVLTGKCRLPIVFLFMISNACD